MKEENKISVVINTYNAEKHLQRVIDAVRTFDEVLICDMESTDSTLDIARMNGCKIVTFPKGEHKSAEPARTFAIQSASCPWVLVVDADEIITPELHDAQTRGIIAFNDLVANDSRVEKVILPLRDGLTIIRKKYGNNSTK